MISKFIRWHFIKLMNFDSNFIEFASKRKLSNITNYDSSIRSKEKCCPLPIINFYPHFWVFYLNQQIWKSISLHINLNTGWAGPTSASARLKGCWCKKGVSNPEYIFLWNPVNVNLQDTENFTSWICWYVEYVVM